MIEIRAASDLDVLRELFREYQAGVNAPVCFASFDTELAGLPVPYIVLSIAYVDGVAAGCVALKPLDSNVAEAKRLYVRPAFRGLQLGSRLMRALAESARQLGFSELRLDTLPFMSAAIELYRGLGFLPIPRYNDNPDPGALFFSLPLMLTEQKP